MNDTSKSFTLPELKEKIYRYCAYQERCHAEVRRKLFELGARTTEVDELIADLITQGFLNEERFAKAFAGGKFRMKKWGRIRITRELEQRGLTAYCIKSGLSELPESDYHEALIEILEKKAAQLSIDDQFVKNDKLANFALQKGYEPELVWQILKSRQF